MLSSKLIVKALRDLAAITGVRFFLLTPSGEFITGTAPLPPAIAKQARQLSGDPEKPSEQDTTQGPVFFSIKHKNRFLYLLAAEGEEASFAGRIAVSEISNLLSASEERLDKDNFIQRILLDNLMQTELHTYAKKLKIREESKRMVCLLEIPDPSDAESVLDALKTMFLTSGSQHYVCPVNAGQIAVVSDLTSSRVEEESRKIAEMINDMLGTQAMIPVRLSYGGVSENLTFLSQSYKEAHLAMEVGKIFFPDQPIISYQKLGIGRLIYHLPQSLCELFLKETFKKDIFKELDKETTATVQQFFDNNLNVSETARQLYVHRNTLVYRLERFEKMTDLDLRRFDDALTFKIAMMVHAYLAYMEKKE